MNSVKMIRVNLMVFNICLFLLSRVGGSWAQSDSCRYQGQEVTGDFTIPGFCLLYRCIPGQGVTAIGCGIRIPPEGCYIEHPDTKNHPECCYTRVVCPGQDPNLSINTNANQTIQGLTYGLPPAPFTTSTTTQQRYSTERPQLVKTLTPPPAGGVTPIFRPRTPQKKRPNDGFKEPLNIYDLRIDENQGSGYYYRK